ncbi:hypothetical protein WP50_04430, partial [Lactiplantibacillus plantarum]
SLVILINNLVFSKTGFIAQILFLPKFFPHLENAQKLLTSVTNGTMNILSIFIAYLVARNLAKYFKADDMLVGMTGIDAFMYTFPITMAASLVILINNLVFSKTGFIAQILFLPKFFPHLENAQKLLTSVTNGTMNILSIFIAYLVARNLAKYFKADDMLVGMTGIACFMILYSPSNQMAASYNQ